MQENKENLAIYLNFFGLLISKLKFMEQVFRQNSLDSVPSFQVMVSKIDNSHETHVTKS
jgi:hypothetical protein